MNPLLVLTSSEGTGRQLKAGCFVPSCLAKEPRKGGREVAKFTQKCSREFYWCPAHSTVCKPWLPRKLRQPSEGDLNFMHILSRLLVVGPWIFALVINTATVVDIRQCLTVLRTLPPFRRPDLPEHFDVCQIFQTAGGKLSDDQILLRDYRLLQ